MANKVAAQVLGGATQVLNDVNTVADVKGRMNLSNHSATVNGVPAENDYRLSDYDFVTLSPAVKGG